MTAPNRPLLEGQPPAPTGPHAAEPTTVQPVEGEPKGAARKGVRTVLCSDPRPADGRYPVAWLHIRAPRGTVPTATSKCLCGWDRSAIGKPRVLALIEAHTAHHDVCPLRSPQEGRHAA
ncbi:hypothetical protein K1Y78_30870 [Streptomyces sp. tea 10]|nr:hypothetical protein [Streptomyces sp. tea 10]